MPAYLQSVHPTGRRLGAALALSLLAMGTLSAQPFTRADSGWVKLFNGTDWTGIYMRTYGEAAPMVEPPPAPTWVILYPGTDTAVMRVGGGPQGNIGTKKTTYSHYRMRVESKFDVLDDNFDDASRVNAGITYHMDETAIRMRNNWTRSIEFQMLQGFTGAAYSIQQVTFDTRASAPEQGAPYSPNGTQYSVCEYGCAGRRWIKGNPTLSNDAGGRPRWLRYELVARGADSAIHIVNDTVVLKLWNIRIWNDSTTATSNRTPNQPWGKGGIGLQNEGARINYRRWEIMEFPAGTPKGENYLHRLFLDSPDKDVTLRAGSVHAIKWRTLGPIPTVNIEYSIGAGAWQSAAANVANTGSYDWTVPATATTQLRLRISGPAWAWADSSSGFNAISAATGVEAPGGVPGPISFSIEGKAEVFTAIGNYTRVEIRDVSGRKVRDLAVRDGKAIWDRRDSAGNKVRAGIYFLRPAGQDAGRTFLALIP